MNERMTKIVIDLLGKEGVVNSRAFGHWALSDEELEKFAELIVRECIKTIEYRAPGQMGKIGEGWTNGYDDGLKTGAWLLKQHFGVE